MIIPNLLIIAGTGNKSGKTTLACLLIEQFRSFGIISVKITPHFHETTPGLNLLKEGQEYSIFQETSQGTSKDTSRMLKAGASMVFFAKVTDRTLFQAFKDIMEFIPNGAPVICESPALRHYVTPGLFIIMKLPESDNQKNINDLLALPHVEFNLTFLQECKKLPVIFSDGKWANQ